MAGEDKPRVIIKRKKVAAHGGAHGGAWKVAYADFVTAMMALFMVLWLLTHLGLPFGPQSSRSGSRAPLAAELTQARSLIQYKHLL